MCVHRGKTMWGYSKKVAVCKPRREALEETKFAGTLILDFQPPHCEEINFCCLRPPPSPLPTNILLWPPEQSETPNVIRRLLHNSVPTATWLSVIMRQILISKRQHVRENNKPLWINWTNNTGASGVVGGWGWIERLGPGMGETFYCTIYSIKL